MVTYLKCNNPQDLSNFNCDWKFLNQSFWRKLLCSNVIDEFCVICFLKHHWENENTREETHSDFWVRKMSFCYPLICPGSIFIWTQDISHPKIYWSRPNRNCCAKIEKWHFSDSEMCSYIFKLSSYNYIEIYYWFLLVIDKIFNFILFDVFLKRTFFFFISLSYFSISSYLNLTKRHQFTYSYEFH